MIVRQRLAWLSALVFFSAHSVQAQWVPVTARVRETHETWKQGKLEKVDHKEGLFYRTSDGSTLKYWTTVNGDEKLGGQGEMTDNKGLVQYSINMKHKYFYEIGTLPEKLTPQLNRPSSSSSGLGDKVIGGLRCHRSSAVVQWPDGRREPMGEECVSIEYNLKLLTDHQVTQGGVTRHVITEMYDINLGAEPDANLFDLQKNGATIFKQKTLETPPNP